MCGIFAYIGFRNSLEIALEGLKKIEYRGYDSAGVAGIKEGRIASCKELGKISALEKELQACNFCLADAAIAQTRWATHGVPSKINAHPHFDTSHSLAVVHNGIIENHESLKQDLIKKGARFVSETDTEVVAHLIGSFYQGDFLQAVQQASHLLKGAFALAIIHKDHPHQIIAIAQECPLVMGIGNNEVFISSDSNAFLNFTQDVVYLTNSEIAVVSHKEVRIYNSAGDEVEKKIERLPVTASDAHKGHFEHYTLKEINEQPQAIFNALEGRFSEEYGTAVFAELELDLTELLAAQRILILGCGTSWNAGYVASYMIEEKARIPVEVEISSEFRYKNPIILPHTLVIAISQSGETADTIAAVREIKAKGGKVIALCNVAGSTLAREADATLFLKCGPEIGVCSTKAFTSQLVVLALLTLRMARMRHLGKNEGQEFLKALRVLPEQIQLVLDNAYYIENVAKKYAQYENFFFLGRRYMYPTALEGALKLKEISYINANGYPAGEIKHGPIALINSHCPTVALCPNKTTYGKLLSNLMEVKARKGPIIAIAEEGEDSLKGVADDIIRIPPTMDELASIPVTVVNQLLAYYIARERGTDIDQPRNLAKSVTVE
ncbi:Glutamine--fructose-6-phosphate aminotransferase [isomerizing] [Neochlamydia sp. AcF65]|uniref:glutamine--fructose-6-phosphate transaminase (isomerizing) n=1 Tax=Neochlamydia sp. AcF65 TaxID=2795735 RepID=UPI001BC99B84|nr:glutamine--fructose-6-phosphate transaminase (isomerizing) [Neochlamydia sp. AcF65]MBS4166922.1 Glutamine--fructose-6-phosphate aminotransferase [isomerizing] [Neochlamydia sp. AcF65]